MSSDVRQMLAAKKALKKLHEEAVQRQREESQKTVRKRQRFFFGLFFLFIAVAGYLALPYFKQLAKIAEELWSFWNPTPAALAQESVYQTLGRLVNYQMEVFSKCGNFTSSAMGITQSGCDAKTVWTPPANCGKEGQNWQGPPFFEKNELDQNNYGYLIFFPFKNLKNFPNEKMPKDRTLLVVGAIKNLDHDSNNDYVVGTTDGKIFHLENDLTDEIEINSLPDHIFVPEVTMPFNLCADSFAEPKMLQRSVEEE